MKDTQSIINRNTPGADSNCHLEYQRNSRLQYYHDVTGFVTPDYIHMNLVTKRQQAVYSRLRIGYKYIQEVIIDCQIKKCTVCRAPSAHTFEHYVNLCHRLRPFRLQTDSLVDQVRHLTEPERLCTILRIFPKFAPPR